jgi:hypothetical protein
MRRTLTSTGIECDRQSYSLYWCACKDCLESGERRSSASAAWRSPQGYSRGTIAPSRILERTNSAIPKACSLRGFANVLLCWTGRGACDSGRISATRTLRRLPTSPDGFLRITSPPFGDAMQRALCCGTSFLDNSLRGPLQGCAGAKGTRRLGVRRLAAALVRAALTERINPKAPGRSL